MSQPIQLKKNKFTKVKFWTNWLGICTNKIIYIKYQLMFKSNRGPQRHDAVNVEV